MNYIVASCKEWHRAGFEQLQASVAGNFIWVANDQELRQAVLEFSPRYIFFLHWNTKVAADLWRHFECVCFHMTDVPFGRGGSPLQNLIVRGVRETQLSALRMVEAMDAGPVYAKVPLDLSGRAEEIYLRAGAASFELIRSIIAQEPVPVAQEGEVVEFRRRTPAQSRLPDAGGLGLWYDHIRMLDAPGYPPAFIEYGDFRLEFSHARLESGSLRAEVSILPRHAAEPSKE